MNQQPPSLPRTRSLRTLLGLLVLPVAFVVASLWPGHRFLPVAPVAYAPLSSEHPIEAKQAQVDANLASVERVFPRLTDQFAVRRAVLSGSMPTWEPNLGLGMPLAASTSGVWYPPNALAWLLPPDQAAGWLALLALFLAGLGMHAFLGARGLSDAARLVGAWSFQAGGFALVHLHSGTEVDAALWLPFAWCAIEGVLARRRFASLLLVASIALSFLAGATTIAAFVACAALLYGIARALKTQRKSAIGAIAIWIAVGVSIAAVAWIPRLEVTEQSMRSVPTSDAIRAASLPITTSASLLVPDLFGRPGDTIVAPHEAVAWWLTKKTEAFAAQTADSLAWSLFAGFTVLVLAIAAIVARPKEALLPAALLVLSLGFAQGWPLVRALYALPGLDLASPARASAIAWALWPWLAALGVEALVSRQKRARAAVQIVAVLALVVGAVFVSQPAEVFAQSLQRTLVERHGVTSDVVESVVPLANARVAGARLVELGESLALVSLAILAVSTIPILRARFSRTRKDAANASTARENAGTAPNRVTTVTWAAVAPWLVLIALEGSYVAREHLAPRKLGDSAVFPACTAIEAIREAAGDGRVVRFEADPATASDVDGLARPNLLAAYGIADLTPCTDFTPRGLVELVGSVDPTAVYRAGLGRLSDPKKLHHYLFDLLRVTCVLSRAPIADPKLELVHGSRELYVYHRKSALPVARVVPAEPIVASGPINVIEYWAAGVEDPRHAAIATAEDLPPASERPRSAEGRFSPGTIEVSRPAADRLDARVTASSGGWLVFHEQWYPGWKATVNGVDAPVVRLDHVCRGVPIPAGDSVVRTKYEPTSMRTATYLSLLALVIALVWTWRTERKNT